MTFHDHERAHLAKAAAALEDKLARIDERALMFDPDRAYRAEVKERVSRLERAETSLSDQSIPAALIYSIVAGAVLVVGLIETVPV